jgi:hypothetical protein
VDRLTTAAGTGLRTSLGPNVPRPVTTAVALAEKGPNAVRLARGAVLAESGDGGTLHLGSADIDVPGPLIAEYQRARDNDGLLHRSLLAEHVGDDAAREFLTLLLEHGAATPASV